MYSANISYDHLPNFIILQSEPLIQTNKPIIVRDMNLHLCDRIVLSENSNTTCNIFYRNFLAHQNKHAYFKSFSKGKNEQYNNIQYKYYRDI